MSQKLLDLLDEGETIIPVTAQEVSQAVGDYLYDRGKVPKEVGRIRMIADYSCSPQKFFFAYLPVRIQDSRNGSQ